MCHRRPGGVLARPGADRRGAMCHPVRMQAIVIRQPGGPEVLERREVPDPEYGPEQVLVRVHASALNRADLLQRLGRYPAPPDAPADIPGLEFAGEVIATGSRVGSLAVGDRVMGIVSGGGLAEKVALHERLCLRMPPRMGWTEAAAIPEAFLTAYDALFAQAGLQPGETVLVQAAASGVGTAACQLAGVAGAFVLGTSRSAAKRERLARMGLFHVIDPGAPDAAERIFEITSGRGAHVVLDLVGAAAWEMNLRVLRLRGRLIVVGLLGGSRCEIDLARLMTKRLTVRGSVLRTRPLEEKIALVQGFRERMLPLLADGRIRPVVDSTLEWGRVSEAHVQMEHNRNFGKIVLTVGDGA